MIPGETMKIVILDGRALNPGDLSWEGLERMGELEVFARTPPEKVVERARDAEIVLTNKTVLSREVLERLPKLRYIGVLATGYNVVDVRAAREKGITVTNVPAYSTLSVAQLVFAHLLNLTHRVGDHARGVREGRWCVSEDFCYWDFPLIELAGLTMGIVGYGRIGRKVADIALAFGMKVLAYKPSQPFPTPEGIEPAFLEDVFRLSDVVSIHCPLTPETEGLVNAERLRLMKPGAFLINTSRGPVVDEAALAEALNSGRLGGAGLDVLSTEPPRPDNPLLGAKNCFITPHIGWATKAARKRLLAEVVSNLEAYLAGKPRNVV